MALTKRIPWRAMIMSKARGFKRMRPIASSPEINEKTAKPILTPGPERVNPKRNTGVATLLGSSNKSGITAAEKSRNPATIRSGTGQEGFLGTTGIGIRPDGTGTGKPEASTAHCTRAPGTIAEGAPTATTTRRQFNGISDYTYTQM